MVSRWKKIVVWVMLAAPSVAAEAQPSSVQLRPATLNGEPVLEQAVTDLHRDDSGMLWIGTQFGLVRYDGTRIRRYESASSPDSLPGGFVTALATDVREDDVLWVATENGSVSRFDTEADRFVSTSLPGDAGRRPAVTVLHVDRRGFVWAGTEGAGLYRLDGLDSLKVYRRTPDAPSLASDTVYAIAAPPSTPGRLWIGTARGLSWLDVEQDTFVTPGTDASIDTAAVTGIAEVGGTVWCGTNDGTLYRHAPSAGRMERVHRLPAGATITTLHASRAHDDVLWIGTRGAGLLAYNTASGTMTPVPAASGTVPAQDVLSVYEDEEGLLWVGAFGALLKASVHGPRFPAPIPGPQMRDGDDVYPVAELYAAPSEPEIVWAGTLRGGVLRYDRTTGARDRLFTDSAHPLHLTFAFREDAEGTFWLGPDRPVLYRMDRSTRTLHEHRVSEREESWVAQIYEAPSRPGTLWISTFGAGLVQFDARRRAVVRTYDTRAAAPHRLSSDEVWAVAADQREPERLWIATHGSGLQRLHVGSGRVDSVQTRAGDCRIPDRIVSVYPAPDGLVWIGSWTEGLFRFDPDAGMCRQFARSDGLVHPDVGGILPDAQGRLWLTSNTGLSVYDPDADVFTRFTEADGLQGERFLYLAEHQTADGTIFAGGQNGFNAFDPLAVPIDTMPPPVVLTQMEVDGQHYDLTRTDDGFAPITLSHRQNDLAFEFAALDLHQPALNQYRVKLEGAQDTWEVLGSKASQRYPLLAPGRYTVRVAGSNRDGYWNETDVRLPIRIRPPYWRAWWFWMLVAAAITLGVWGLYRVRIEQFRRLERTRQRIADDLHDDIGSKISTVALRLDLTSHNRSLSEAARQELAVLSGTARRVVDDLRDTVWIVDAEHDSLEALVARIEQFARSAVAGPTLTVDRPDDLPDVMLSMNERRHVYLFAKEALHNAARHSQADRVAVHIALDGARLLLRIQDDGIGFDPDAVAAGRGLSTLRRRADAVGGTCAIHSAPGAGTQIRMAVKIM